jgi:outer membrane protein
MRGSPTTLKLACATFLGGLLAVVLLTGQAAAQQQPAAPSGGVIGIIDDQAVIQNSKAGKALQADLNKQYAAFKAEIGQQEATLRSQEQQLQQQQSAMATDVFEKKRQEFAQQVEQYRKNAQIRKDQLDRASATGLRQLRETLAKVTAEIASARGMSLVLLRSSVLLSSANVDITPDVLKRFDQTMPTVSLPKAN